MMSNPDYDALIEYLIRSSCNHCVVHVAEHCKASFFVPRYQAPPSTPSARLVLALDSLGK